MFKWNKENQKWTKYFVWQKWRNFPMVTKILSDIVLSDKVRVKIIIIIILKDVIKQPKSLWNSFSFLIDCYISTFFSFLIKAFADFEKLIRIYLQAFVVYKNGENLKILIEIFCQKLIVSNVILAFLNHLKPKIFFVGQP